MYDSFSNHLIIPEKLLILQYFYGSIGLKEAIRGKQDTINDPQYAADFNTIIDFRDTKLWYSDNEIKEYIEFLRNKNALSRGQSRTAHLTNTPNQVGFLILFASFLGTESMNYRIVSTLKAAIFWVGLKNQDIPIIEKSLNELKNRKVFH